jgi:hypothetical protein
MLAQVQGSRVIISLASISASAASNILITFKCPQDTVSCSDLTTVSSPFNICLPPESVCCAYAYKTQRHSVEERCVFSGICSGMRFKARG